MQTRFSLLRRLTLSTAIGLCMASAAALAIEASDSTEVQVSVDGKTETVVLDNLKIGESRQLYSEAGTLVTAVRTADGIELDIGGEKTRINLPEPGVSGDALADFLLDGRDAGDGKTRIVRVHKSKDGAPATVNVQAGGAKRVVLVSHDGEIETLDADTIDALIDEAGSTNGKRVVVKRRITTDGASAD